VAEPVLPLNVSLNSVIIKASRLTSNKASRQITIAFWLNFRRHHSEGKKIKWDYK
jgi:hypothetical protein